MQPITCGWHAENRSMVAPPMPKNGATEHINRGHARSEIEF